MRVGKTFVSAYNDIFSPESRALISVVIKVLKPIFQNKLVGFVEMIIKRLFKGSIGVEFDIVFQPASNVSNTSIVQAFEEGNDTGELAPLNIKGGITVTEQVPVTDITTQSPPATTANSTGILLLL